MKERDISVLKHMLKYANEIPLAKSCFGDNYNEFRDNALFRNTVAMSLLQIGELTTHLSEEFKETFSKKVNWRGLKSFRNICAHDYSRIDTEVVWHEINTFLPGFIEFCTEQVKFASDDEENIEDDSDVEI
jgi:uncharacterized protein with HEPN domain